MQRHERRRTRCVHGDRGSLETEHVRDPARHHRTGATGCPVAAVVRQFGRRGVTLVGAADEHAGVRAPPRDRVDARPFEDLPRRLQQQPLLRIHRQCLPRRDTEEPGVEIPRAGKETTRETGHLPAAVRRQPGHRFTLVGEQPPQLLRRPDPARESARHPHDRHRFIGPHGRLRRRWHIRRVTGQLARDVLGERAGGREVEGQRRRQPEPGHRGERVAQFHHCQRIESQVAQRPVRLDDVRPGMPQHRGGSFAHQVQRRRSPVPGRQAEQSLADSR
ncbi:hypothetical protein KIPE111705_46885 [Kibdelosporangium persicum]